MRALFFWVGSALLLWCTLGVVYSVTVRNTQTVTPMQRGAALASAAALAGAFVAGRRGVLHPGRPSS
ncbi:MAG: hypothetical protein FJ144_14285 [Deltaproteobacteria bacterium]|nr:hypothetical protein [Deltaproteobacteria bacterium]